MITHVVLFRPKRNLPAEVRQGLAGALRRALREIPSLRGVRVGRRVTHGRAYELLMKQDYPYAALLDFDDVAGLKAYLEHPAHEELSRRFYEAFDEGLIYDFDIEEGETGIARLATDRLPT